MDQTRRIKELFQRACELDADVRSKFLDDACGADVALRAEVDSLLAHDDQPIAEHFRVPAYAPLETDDADTFSNHQLPTNIGSFRIIRKIGEGGMGTVYEAEQEKPRRTVALKVIRPGIASRDMLRRFEREAHVLGQLQHPGITHIFEAGMANTQHGEQPYFAMELVHGETLGAYVKGHEIGTRERLALVALVCDAIHHAHQKGFVHRDLKPGNLLVNESGQPKILDFGVARATHVDQSVTMQTEVGQILGTIPYMSPEQVTGRPDDLDTRSDVYAMGVILFELLAGKLPYNVREMSIPEATRVIREEDPTRLSSLRTEFRGDIEIIVARALEKDRERRYGSAAEFAADIRRYLSNQPIIARPPSTLYQLRKFSTRNRALVGSTLAVFLAVIAGAVVSVDFALSEAKARVTAEAQASRARKISTFLTDMLRQVEPSEAQGEKVTVREVLDASASGIGDIFDGESEVEAAIRYTIGSVYVRLGEYDRAEPMLLRALDLRRKELEYESIDTVNILNDLGSLRLAHGKREEALRLYEEAVTLSKKTTGLDSAATLTTLEYVGDALRELGRLDEARDIINEVIEGRHKLYGPDHEKIISANHNLGIILIGLGEYAEAEVILTDALAGIRKYHGLRHPKTAMALQNLTYAMTSNGRFKEAEPFARECVEVNRILYGDNNSKVADALGKQANVLQKLGNYVEAESILREAIEIQEHVKGADPMTITRLLVMLSDQLYHQDRFQEAEKLQRRGITYYESLAEPDTADHAWAIHSLTINLVKQKRFDEAEPLQRNAVRMMRKVKGNDHPSTTIVMSNLGNIMHRKGDLIASARITQEVYESQVRLLGEDHPEVTVAMMNLGTVKWKAGDPGSAETLVRSALKRFRKERGDEHPYVTYAMGNLAGICSEQKNYDEATQLRRDVLERKREQYGNEHQKTAIAEGKLGEVLRKRGDAHGDRNDFEEAETLLLNSHAYLSANLPTDDGRVKSAAERLANLYIAWGRPEEATTWQNGNSPSTP